MKISLRELGKAPDAIDKLIIESVDLSLYIASASIAGEERVISKNDGSILKTRNLLDMKRQLKSVASCEMILRQRSPYDEMVGHNYQATDNTLELSLGDQPLPEWLS
ncbi:DUF6482 family protein [Luminiphilus syltensis]|uniref:DUF6482 family protein n=1 Tax=Luminiphilus syltensis TaxID=1341119 RepID=UPI0002EEB1A4|nr:DUF6482 family protein [Luminiphilus syltensis]